MEPKPSTIAAIATPMGSGGIGIIKVSGPEAIVAVDRLFIPSNRSRRLSGSHPDGFLSRVPSHTLHYGRIRHPKTGEMVDEVIVSVMRGPHSYTGEDVCEVNAHGGVLVLHTIVALLTELGVAAARPGEFTLRAFLNGRIDLTQAEAVCDIINARSEAAVKLAARQLGGGIRRDVERIQNEMRAVLAVVEAGIDFGDVFDGVDDLPDVDPVRIEEGIIGPLKRLIGRHDQYQMVREGARIVIAGKPNVGKSTLFNAMVRHDRAIVTPIPGTTRDTIEVEREVGGVSMVFVDTAGIQPTRDPLEAIGIERSLGAIASADHVLFLVDASRELDERDLRVYGCIQEKPFTLVANKADLLPKGVGHTIPDLGGQSPMLVCAKQEKGVERLLEAISLRITGGGLQGDDTGAVPNRRHRQALSAGLEHMERARSGMDGGAPMELMALDVRNAMEAIGEIVGAVQTEQLLDQIFSSFCIGK